MSYEKDDDNVSAAFLYLLDAMEHDDLGEVDEAIGRMRKLKDRTQHPWLKDLSLRSLLWTLEKGAKIAILKKRKQKMPKLGPQLLARLRREKRSGEPGQERR